MYNQPNNSYYLPKETAEQLTPESIKKCKNLGLILDKYPSQAAIQKSEGKSIWLKEIAAGNYIDTKLAESVYQRWLRTTTATGAQHFNATTDWRIAVGLGGETVLETDLTLHHIYGFPYIPGSALKGLTRAYVTGEVAEHKSKKIDNDDAVVKRIFGSQEGAGTVIFFDAMPVHGKTHFVLDIMNSHYPYYYAEKKPPTNDQKPNPVAFLTVTNTTFTFALAPRDPQKVQHQEDIALALEWLQKALKDYGIGGKTSAGYGYLTVSQEQEIARSSQTAQKTSVSTEPIPYIRPKIPTFREGQEITGSVVAPTDELRQIAPEAKAFLHYLSFATKEVLLIVTVEDAQNWKPGETRICLFVREEVRNNCTVLVCQPRASKKKKSK